jgi:hypothetical protein
MGVYTMRWESGKKAKRVTAPAGLAIFEVGVRVPHCEIGQTHSLRLRLVHPGALVVLRGIGQRDGPRSLGNIGFKLIII